MQGSSATPPSLPPGTLDLGNGISMVLNYTGEFAANPSGGIRQGSAYAGQIAFGLDADLGRLAGIDGGSVHTVVTQRHGRSWRRMTSASTAACRRSTAAARPPT